MKTLEEEIKAIIEEEMECKYVGWMKVNVDGDYYELLLHRNQEQAPFHLGYQGTEEEFKKFIKEEFHFRKGNDTRYWTAIRDYAFPLWNFDNIIEI